MIRLPRNKVLSIPRTLQVVSSCWTTAEQLLQEDIRDNIAEGNEEFITTAFHGKLAQCLREASEEGRVETGFRADLDNAFPEMRGSPQHRRIARWLIADVTLHHKGTEKNTGGDFGFVIARPEVQDLGMYYHIDSYRCGLLCQAKLKKWRAKWGSFTPPQKQSLPNRMEYLGLLLYRYVDRELHNLERFQWQLCNGYSLSDASSWLKQDDFPKLLSSDDVIRGVGNGNFGTDDKKILDDIVAPSNNPSLVLTISWPHGSEPDSEVSIYSRSEVKSQIKVRL